MPFTYLNPPILALDPFYFGGNVTEASLLTGLWQTLSVNQGPSVRYGTDYPFVDPGTDVSLLLGDLFLQYTDNDCGFELPFKVAWMYGFGTVANGPIAGFPAPTHDLDIIIQDANGETVFDSTECDPGDFTQTPWGVGLETVTWCNQDGTLHLTRHTSFPEWYEGSDLNQFIEPTNGQLSGRTYMRMPRHVRSIRVGLTEMQGDFLFTEGFNLRMQRTEVENADGARRRTQLEMRAVAGDGLGRQPGCEDEAVVIRRINGVEGTEGGDFKMDPVGCYWFKKPNELVGEDPRSVSLLAEDLSVVGAEYGVDLNQILEFSPISSVASLRMAIENPENMMQLLNQCGPCCECDDYVRVYRALKRVFERYQALGARAEDARDIHAANIARWEEQADCRRLNPVRMIVRPLLNGRLAIGASHCNLTECCVQNVVMRLTFEGFEDGTPMLTDPDLAFRCERTTRKGTDTNYEEVAYAFSGTYPIFDTYFDFSDPQASATLQTLINVATAAENQAMRVTLSVHTPEILNPDGKTCPTTDPAAVEVPAEVQTLWDTVSAPPYPVRGLIQKTVPINPDESCCS